MQSIKWHLKKHLVISFHFIHSISYFKFGNKYHSSNLFLQTGPFLSSLGIPDSQIGPAMTIGQFAEILTMAFLGYFLKNIGFKKVITIGISAYCLRYAIFGSEFFPVWIIVISQAFHGFCYAFFFAAAYLC